MDNVSLRRTIVIDHNESMKKQDDLKQQNQVKESSMEQSTDEQKEEAAAVLPDKRSQDMLDSFKELKTGLINDLEKMKAMSQDDMNKVSMKNDDSKDPQECWHCLKKEQPESPPFLRCSVCKVVYYCSKECQTTSWKKEHEIHCKEIFPMILPFTGSSNQKDSLYAIAYKSETWGMKTVAATAIKSGQLILSVKPMIHISSFRRDEIHEKLTEMQRDCLFLSEEEEKSSSSVSKKSKKSYVARDDVKIFGPSFPCNSQRARLAFYIIRFHWKWIWTSFFETGLLGENQEADEIEKLYKYIYDTGSIHLEGCFNTDDKRKVVTLDLVSLAYAMARQCEVVVIDNFENKSAFSTTFTPLLTVINHSCNPNTILYFSKGVFYLFASRAIEKGEQIFRDYINNNSDVIYWDPRRRMLIGNNHFICKCIRCVAEMADPSVPKHSAVPDEGNQSPEKKEEREKFVANVKINPYLNQNVSKDIKTRFMNAEAFRQKPGFAKQWILEIPHDTVFRDYLFKSDWPLFNSLVYDTMKWELDRHFNNNINLTTTQGSIVVDDEYDSRYREKYGNTAEIRLVYIQIIDMFIEHVESNFEEINQNRNPVKRLTIFRWMKYCLLLWPYLDELDEKYKDVESKIREWSTQPSIASINGSQIPLYSRAVSHWYTTNLMMIVPESTVLKLQECISWLDIHYYAHTLKDSKFIPLGLLFIETNLASSPRIFYRFHFYAKFISFILYTKAAGMFFRRHNDPAAKDITSPRSQEDKPYHF